MPKPLNEKKNLQMLAEGSEYAFTELFDHYHARIFSVAKRFIKSRELAEEIVQEVFLKVWIKREEMTTVLNFEGYLFTMARHQIFDCIKDIAKETTAKRESTHGQHLDAPDNPLIEKQFNELLHQAVNQLPPQQKRIFRLAKIDGLSHQAIAEQLHLSRLTVKTHMAKALQTLRQNLLHHITTLLLPLLCIT